MDPVSIAAVMGGLFLFSLVAGRLRGSIITPPLIFIAFGYLIGSEGLSIADLDPGHGAIHFIAEITLILILFADAARIDLKQLRRDHNLPIRMLTIGMPLTIIMGALIATQIFPQFSFWEAMLLAALLAPTDAALGQAVVSDKIVPVRIRQAINVESGLNDGIALPAVLLFAALASAGYEASAAAEWIGFGLKQIILGPLVGLVVGFAGARLLDTAAEHGWASISNQGIGVLALALIAYVAAELVGGNGFISAFIGGIAFGNSVRHPCSFLFDFMETEGQLLMLITFMVFGAVLLPEGLQHLTAATLAYAALSLTVIRMIPVAISFIGTGLKPPTWLFLGWFGPRGLASILFALLILKETEIGHNSELLTITIITVALSALLHGLTAAPFAKVYGNLAARMGKCEENQSVTEIPLREGPVK